MDDIQRQDRRLFTQELLSPGRLVGTAALLLFWFVGLRQIMDFAWLSGAFLAITGGHILFSWRASVDKRWIQQRFKSMWMGCEDRLSRFSDVLKQMRRDQVADLQEMPRTIERVGSSLYAALRRADIIEDEIMRTERDLHQAPPTYGTLSHDVQAKELYKIADRNIAEYRQQYAGVIAGVHRAEAQAAVYMTTLDNLRMKMIGHRLAGRGPEMSTQDFLEALGEAKLQLQAIDQALDELDFSTMPKTVTLQPPPIPDSIRQRLGEPPE